MPRGTVADFGRSICGISIHLGKSMFGIFEILKHYGASWKINILEFPSKYRLPPLHHEAQAADIRRQASSINHQHQAPSIEHRASTIKHRETNCEYTRAHLRRTMNHQASNIKHQASGTKHQAASIKHQEKMPIRQLSPSKQKLVCKILGLAHLQGGYYLRQGSRRCAFHRHPR